MREEGFVSECEVSNCIYNQDMNCHAEAIQVAVHADHADCETFTPE